MAVDFANVLRGKLQERFPEFGTDREINCITNYLNPSIKGIHLRLTKKLKDTKATMEEKLKSWKYSVEFYHKPGFFLSYIDWNQLN